MLISILIYNSQQMPTAEYLQSFSGDFEIVLLVPESSVPVSAAGSLKIIPLPENINLQEKCLAAAGQLTSDYVLLSDRFITQSAAAEIFQDMKSNRLLIGQFENCICMHRTSLLQAGSITKLTQFSQNEAILRFYDAEIDSVIHLNEPIGDIMLSALNHREVISQAIERYLADLGRGTFYSRLFLQSLQDCLKFPPFFAVTDISPIQKFYQDVQIENLDKVPWYVALLQSFWHLNHDKKDYQIPPCTKTDKVAVLVSVFNECAFTEICLKALRKFSGSIAHIVVINNSTDDISAFKKRVVEHKLADVWLESGCNAHAEGLNRALPYVRDFRYLCTLDNDAIALRKGWLEDMLQILKDHNAGIAGPKTFPWSNIIKAVGIHPCCMLLDQQLLAGKFQIDFCNQWPWDVGHLLTWDCLAHSIPIAYVSHDVTKDQAVGSSLINNSVRHFWYASRILKLPDDETIDGIPVGLIRAKLREGLRSQEIKSIDYSANAVL
jgi:hypothetical protein